MAPSADGHEWFTLDQAGKVQAWDGRTGRERFAVDLPHPVTGGRLLADPFSKALRVVGTDRVLQTIDLPARRARAETVVLDEPAEKVRWAYTPSRAVAFTPSELHFWDLRKGKREHTNPVPREPAPLRALALDGSGDRVAVAGEAITLLGTAPRVSGRELLTIAQLVPPEAGAGRPRPAYVALAFCEYWRGLAAVNDANVLQLWDVEGLQMRWSAQLPGRFRLLAVAPDDPWVAVLDHGGRLLLFHSKTGALRANLTLERAAGQAEQGEPAVALAPDGQGVAVLWDGEVRLWELDRVGAPPR